MAAPTMIRPLDPAPQAAAEAKPTEPQPKSPMRRRSIQIAGAVAAFAAVLGTTVALRNHGTDASPTSVPPTSTIAPTDGSPPPPPPGFRPPTTAPPAPAPTHEPTTEGPRTGFYGEWGQHSTSITLAPDGTAHYAIWLGAANGASWSATWSTMSATEAMTVLTKQLTARGDTDNQWLHRYEGEALTFTLRSGGYATITGAQGKPVTLCPRNTDFRDTQGLCGA